MTKKKQTTNGIQENKPEGNKKSMKKLQFFMNKFIITLNIFIYLFHWKVSGCGVILLFCLFFFLQFCFPLFVSQRHLICPKLHSEEPNQRFLIFVAQIVSLLLWLQLIQPLYTVAISHSCAESKT